MTVAIVVEECSACVPVLFKLQQTGFTRHIGEGAVAIVVVKNVPAIIGDEKVQVAVIVVVPVANPLAPAVPHQSCFFSDVGKSPVVVVTVQVVCGFLAFGKILQAPAVDDEDIQPTIVVIVEERDTAAGRGKQKVFVLMTHQNGF